MLDVRVRSRRPLVASLRALDKCIGGRLHTCDLVLPLHHTAPAGATTFARSFGRRCARSQCVLALAGDSGARRDDNSPAGRVPTHTLAGCAAHTRTHTGLPRGGGGGGGGASGGAKDVDAITVDIPDAGVRGGGGGGGRKDASDQAGSHGGNSKAAAAAADK